MADRLPLAKLSIQIKIRPPAERTQPIKTKKVHPSNTPELRCPCSLDTLLSLANKWSAMTHLLQATVKEFKSMIILYAHYYFHQDCVLLTHAYVTSTSATTVGEGGDPHRSTGLDDKSGHNCPMTDIDFQIFAHLVLGLDSTHNDMGTGSRGHKQRNCSFVNMLHGNFATITNLHPVIHNKIANN
jgi:hypothetical protein